jgi:hypothetical protein
MKSLFTVALIATAAQALTLNASTDLEQNLPLDRITGQGYWDNRNQLFGESPRSAFDP